MAVGIRDFHHSHGSVRVILISGLLVRRIVQVGCWTAVDVGMQKLSGLYMEISRLHPLMCLLDALQKKNNLDTVP